MQSGWRRRNDDNVLFLTFEEMKADLRGTAARIAELMDVDVGADEQRRVDAFCRAELTRLGSDFPYADAFD